MDELEREMAEQRKRLRDEFAMAALSGLCANSNDAFLMTAIQSAEIHGEKDSSATFARYAYEQADAMLKARDA